jgi:hypothetical protein
MRDWTPVINLANRLITRNGRPVQFVQNVQQAAADPDKPWRGTSAQATDNIQTLNAVFVPDGAGLGFNSTDNDLFRTSEQICIVAPELGAAYDLADYHQVVEANSKEWRFNGVMKLQPGDTILLYIIGLKN